MNVFAVSGSGEFLCRPCGDSLVFCTLPGTSVPRLEFLHFQKHVTGKPMWWQALHGAVLYQGMASAMPHIGQRSRGF